MVEGMIIGLIAGFLLGAHVGAWLYRSGIRQVWPQWGKRERPFRSSAERRRALAYSFTQRDDRQPDKERWLKA